MLIAVSFFAIVKQLILINMKTNYIKTTLTFKFLCEEAIEMSFKYIHDIFYIIQRGNTLYITSIKEDGVIYLITNTN